MDVAQFLDELQRGRAYQGQLKHLETLPERAGQFAEPATPLPDALRNVLAARGIDALYVHQAATLERARAGRDTVVVTGTASGKTLCYNLPILETCLQDPDARALYLFPTKALAQDQKKGLEELLAGDPQMARRLKLGVYDGDTPTAQRRRIRDEAALVLSNPDMLHASILPYHPKWGRFFSDLRYVVIDEVHMYRGILGAHVSCVLRRLDRVCRHYGSKPVLLAASATIANPGELASRLLGRDVEVVDQDGSPRGRKYFALWEPPPAARDDLTRRSASDEATDLLVAAVEHDAQALAFTRTRQAAELIQRYAREQLQARRSPMVEQVRAYRGGYLPDERRSIERDLAAGTLRGVATTNALELGIDIGSLDVAILVGYPGTIASCWQQAGRSGRRAGESLAVLVAGNDPVDQYLLRHPQYFFQQSPEHAVVDPENPYVLAAHLKSASFELPLEEEDTPRFGPLAGPIAELLCDSEELNRVDGRYYFAGGGTNPAIGVSLRHMSDNTFSIVLVRGGARPIDEAPRHVGREPRKDLDHEVIANVDAISAPELVYPQAVYLHNAETYFVRKLDLEGRVAYVERREMDYYTQAILESQVKITGERVASDALPAASVAFGDVDVTWQTVAFKKIKFSTRENVGWGTVDIPPQTLPTTAVWIAPDEALKRELKAAGYRMSEALAGVRNLAVVALPIVAMSDPADIGGIVNSSNLGRPAVILYDRYPGGLGYSEKGFQHVGSLLAICREMVEDCPCEDGCPSCVGLPNLRPAIHSDPDLSRGHPIPNKEATKVLLRMLVESAASEVVEMSNRIALGE